LELTAAYSTFPNMGMRVDPVLVKKVVDRFGRVLEDNTAAMVRTTPESFQDNLAMAWIQRRMILDLGSALVPATRAPDAGSEPEAGAAGILSDTRQGQSKEPGPSPANRLDALLGLAGPGSPPQVARRKEPVRVISPQTAYLMLSMLRDVCASGTAASASRLRRKDLGGKTGTTDDCSDAWFIGFNTKYTAGVWMGYDTKVPLGRKEHGSVAALPVWMGFMKEVLAGSPQEGYPPPPGIAFLNFQGARGPRRPDLAALLESGPVPARELAKREVSGVDMTAQVGAAGADPAESSPYPVFPVTGRASADPETYAGFSSFFPTGMVRVLSPRGETLGYASSSLDAKGKTIIHRESFEPIHDPRQDGDHEPRRKPTLETKQESDSLRSQRASAGILRELRRLLPRVFRSELHP
jgi:penicillin-binding protein 1A